MTHKMSTTRIMKRRCVGKGRQYARRCKAKERRAIERVIRSVKERSPVLGKRVIADEHGEYIEVRGRDWIEWVRLPAYGVRRCYSGVNLARVGRIDAAMKKAPMKWKRVFKRAKERYRKFAASRS